MVGGHEPIFDLFVFLAYISIPLEILIFGIFLRKKLFKGEMSFPKIIVLSVGILFVSFILCCGVTHLLGFMSGVICHGQEISNKSPFCEGMGQGPLAGYVYTWKLITAVISCITAFALGMPPNDLCSLLVLSLSYRLHTPRHLPSLNLRKLIVGAKKAPWCIGGQHDMREVEISRCVTKSRGSDSSLSDPWIAGLLMKPILEFVTVFTMLSSETSGNMQVRWECPGSRVWCLEFTTLCSETPRNMKAYL